MSPYPSPMLKPLTHNVLGIGIAFGILAMSPGSARTAELANPDWPCIQRKVPVLSAGMMWAGPPPGPDASQWRTDRNVADLVERLAVRRTSLDDANALISAFVIGLEESEKPEKISQVFYGLLEMVNVERKDIMESVERYVRKQRRLADQIFEKRQDLNTILNIESPTDEDDEKRRTLETELNWQTRIHEERERSLVYVCEIPVLVDQRLFEIARTLANELE